VYLLDVEEHRDSSLSRLDESIIPPGELCASAPSLDGDTIMDSTPCGLRFRCSAVETGHTGDAA
jgi:hypothetical protein